jgi:hypothetical protein
MTREPLRRLAQVPFDDIRGPDLRRGRITSGFPQCTPLPQQVPALIQLDLQIGQPPGGIRGGVGFFEQLMFFGHQALNVRQHRYVLVDTIHSRPP